MKNLLTVFVLIFSLAVSGLAFAAEKSEPAQKFCPVLGEPIDKNVYTDYKGKRVYFCCKACIETFKSDPELYMKKLKEQEEKKSDKKNNKKSNKKENKKMPAGHMNMDM